MSRNEKEIEDLAGYRTGVMVGGKWKIKELLDEGGFGKVYRVEDMSSPGNYAALKIESQNMEGGSAIKLEKSALERIHKHGRKNHVPMLFRSSRRRNICYMIVTLLGENLRRIKDRYFPKGYPLNTWSKVAIQCLYGIKTVHDAGFVHRDIKAANFVLGHSGEPKKARIVHIIDFGLARQYALEDPKRPLVFRPRPARAHTDFRGTWSFASPSMHDGAELGRKDDLWSLLFMLMDLYATLPWEKLENVEQIGRMKQNMKDEDMLIKMPRELLAVPKHLRKLDVYNRPNYRLIYDCFDKCFTRSKASWSEPYAWENPDMAARNLRAQQSEPQEYMDCGPFMMLDPIKINTGPSKWIPGDDQLTKPSCNRSVNTTTTTTVTQEQPSGPGTAPAPLSAEKLTNSKSPLTTSVSRPAR